MMAAAEFQHEGFDAARRLYTYFLDRYPTSDWAWVAALRVGQLDEALGNPAGAARRFAETFETFADVPWARRLGAVYAARATEHAGTPRRALVWYREALDAWPAGAESSLALGWPPRQQPGRSLEDRQQDPSVVNREDVVTRVGQLSRFLPQPAGEDLERGRFLLAQGRAEQALATFDLVRAAQPGSAPAAEAVQLSHRARLELAIEKASAREGKPDVNAALAELEALGREPFDPWIGVAGVARASLLLVTGNKGDAADIMQATLTRWASWSAAAANAPLPEPGSLEHDVLAIRDAVFRPMGGGIYGTGRRGLFQWPASPPAFLIARAALRVTLPGHDGPLVVPVSFQPAGLDGTILVDDEVHARLLRLPAELGGAERRTPQEVMEVPNQPEGHSRDIVELWNRYFFARPGHWGSWLTLTPPSFEWVQFSTAARTRATVIVRFMYSGTTVVLEKGDGRWTMKELSGFWIE